ncbi:MAG: penicillin-binding protein activator [Woeseia sp.]
MKQHRKVTIIVNAILTGFLLSACATGDFGGFAGNQAERRADTLAMRGQHADAAALYIDLASRATGNERDRLTLLAVEQWLDAGDGRRARNAMRDVSTPDGGERLWLWHSNLAALALWDGNPDEALKNLETLGRETLPSVFRSRVEALRADAWFQKDDPARAVEIYMLRESWLDGRQRVDLNRRRLWAGLRVGNVETLRKAAETEGDPVVRGWLMLGALAASTGQQGVGWSNGVARWRDLYADHPATAVLADLRLPDGTTLEYPSQIALLLPLSGQNANAGNAVRNGFFGAYFASSSGLEQQQSIRVYDAANGNARDLYARAIADGAEFVVGPLLRPRVMELAGESVIPVPVLTLNYLPDEMVAPPGLYQFALAPEDEAASVATRAVADGHRRALALVPNNDWGRRVMTSFASSFEAAGGRLLDYRDYQPSSQDFSIDIEGLMALSQSVQRYQRLRANIGGPLQFDPRRRQDADFVFLAADASAGRLLKSQLKFHYAGDLPVYSTSFIYSMDGRSDADLNGIMFADTPWIVSPPAWIADMPALYQEYWPDERRLGRLHAMGYDAYQLIGELYGARTGPMNEIDGATGTLYLDEDGRVHRRLAWARFERGQPVAVPDAPGRDFLMRDSGTEAPAKPAEEWQRTPLEQ